MPTETSVKRARRREYKTRLASIRNNLKKLNKIAYDETREVWIIKRTISGKKISVDVGRALTDKEKSYFAHLGFSPDGWRRIESRQEAIGWIADQFDPDQFENFCIAILNAHNVSLRITEKRPISGADGGFDGEGHYVIDKISHPVALQAKKYAVHRQVGDNHCREFVGGLIGRRWK